MTKLGPKMGYVLGLMIDHCIGVGQRGHISSET